MRFVARLEGHEDQPAVMASLDAWLQDAKRSNWKTPADVKARHTNASIVGADRVVFNIRGNRYRLIVSVNYSKGIVFIKWIGSHREYDKIDARTVEYAPETD